MKQFYILSDVHGFHDEMRLALDNAGFDISNENHVFVSLGDLLDRGQQPRECLEFVNSIPNNRKILIRGNHEDLMQHLLKFKTLSMTDFHNGTAQTLLKLTNVDMLNTLDIDDICEKLSNDEQWITYVNSTIDYFETKNYVFVHGWIPDIVRNKLDSPYHEYDPDWRFGNWEQARWSCGWRAWKENIKIPNKTIICGHWHCLSFGLE